MKLVKLAVLSAALLAPGLAFAQSYPDRAVRVIIPQQPGSSSDILGRQVADKLSKLWGQPVVIENMPGGATMIGTGAVTQAEKDGYTLLFHSSSLSSNTATTANLAFDPKTDLVPVSVVATGDMVILTGSKTPLPTLQDVATKAKEGTTLFQAYTGGTGGLLGSLFKREAGIEMTQVDYKSPPDALIDLAGGRVDFFVTSTTSFLNSAAADKSTPVAVASAERSPALPDVPTTAEAGFPTVVVMPWWGLFAPTGTPAEVLAKLNADVNTVMADPEMIESLKASHSRPQAMSLEEAAAFISKDMAVAAELLSPAK